MFMIHCGTSAREPGELLDHDHDEAGAAISEAVMGRGGAAILALGQSGNEGAGLYEKKTQNKKENGETTEGRPTTVKHQFLVQAS